MDTLSAARRSENMRRIRATNTGPEMALRRLVHSLGYRYRLHSKALPGKPDLVFAGRRKVIFVHGCFWHQHPGCIDCHTPKSATSYWVPKLERNKARDAANARALRGMGWEPLVVWECELKRPQWLGARIRSFLGPASGSRKALAAALGGSGAAGAGGGGQL